MSSEAERNPKWWQWREALSDVRCNGHVRDAIVIEALDKMFRLLFMIRFYGPAFSLRFGVLPTQVLEQDLVSAINDMVYKIDIPPAVRDKLLKLNYPQPREEKADEQEANP